MLETAPSHEPQKHEHSQSKKFRLALGLTRMRIALLVLLQSIGEGIRGMREGKRYRTCGALGTTPGSDRKGPRC